MILRTVYIVLSLLFFAVLAFVVWTYRDGKRIRRQFHQGLDRLEQRYRDFLRKRIAVLYTSPAGPQPVEVSALAQEAIAYLKPDIEALFTTLENHRGASVTLRYDDKFFSLLAAKMEPFLLEDGTGEPEPLPPAKREALYQVVQDLIEADLRDQVLSWQAGEALG